jgi:cytochrome P450 PksS
MTHLNPGSPENLLNPAPLYRALRESSPVHWSEEAVAGAGGVWFITRHSDVTNAFRDPRLSTERAPIYEAQMRYYHADSAQEFGQICGRMMVNRDGMKHLSIRRQASPGFTPQALDAYLPTIHRIMGMQLDRVEHLGRMDLVKEISHHLPPLVIADLFGLPSEDRDRFLRWAEALSEFFTPRAGSDIALLAKACGQAMKELGAYLDAIINERRGHSGQDMLSRMINAQEMGKMSQEELVANAILMVTAGQNTTTDQISNGIYNLLTHPDQLQKLREEPSLGKSAVEEILRFDPAVPYMTRIATQDITLHGQTIRAGQLVFLGIAAANRDPSVFPDPERFDITRDYNNQKHLTFAFGAHHCMGAGLARRELLIATETLLNRLPNLRLDETQQPERKCQGLVFRGFTTLPVCW